MMGMLFNMKESKPLYVMEKVVRGVLTVREAAEALGLSMCQVFRLKGEMKQTGEDALIHGNRGRAPINASSKVIKDRIVSLARDCFRGASVVSP